ncbi:MAG TPA: hypothetical protein VMT85_11905 [Thermoanaerobaculia bacterium]|nr:hypothetical protein [Thermoanaerobaculia bacterium]
MRSSDAGRFIATRFIATFSGFRGFSSLPRILRARLPRILGGLIVPLALLGLACGGGDEEEPANEPVVVEELGLRFVRLPAGFSVVENGSRLVLEGAGTMTVEAGEPSDFGLDPVADATAQQARFESLEGGEFRGAQRLVTPSGPGAYARGRFTRDGQPMEETAVFVVHPSANRMVSLSYVYPAGEDSSERVQSLLELVAEMESTDVGGSTGVGEPTDPGEAAAEP